MAEPLARRRLVVGASFVAVRLVILVAMLVTLRSGDPSGFFLGDAARYHQIASTHGRPYRDFEVEFPPVSLMVIEAVDGGDARSTAVNLAWLMFACDLVVAGALLLGWGERAAMTYFLLSTPIAFLVFFRIDLLSVALTVGAVLFLRKGRSRLGGVTFAAAAMAKVWPLILFPLLIVRREWRALGWAVGSFLAGLLAWVWWAGIDGPIQVITFRHATGWEVGSPIAVLVHYVASPTVHFINGGYRVGTSPTWAQVLLALGVVGLAGWAWMLSWRRPETAEGLASLCSVGVLLILSPLLSEQFVIWLLPWAAIAATQGELHIERGLLVVTALSALVLLVPASVAGAAVKSSFWALRAARDLALIALVAAAFRHLATATRGDIFADHEARLP
jgi:Glycosyltransferase family 87